MNDYGDLKFRDEAREGWRIGRWVLIGIVFVLLVSAAIWGISVATSGARGKGDAYQEKNSAKNWTQAQAEFNDRYQDILASDKNISVAAVALKRDPKSTVKQTNYDGLVRYCNTAVGEYNSLARKYLAKDFRDADLPPNIDGTDPAADCKE